MAGGRDRRRPTQPGTPVLIKAHALVVSGPDDDCPSCEGTVAAKPALLQLAYGAAEGAASLSRWRKAGAQVPQMTQSQGGGAGPRPCNPWEKRQPQCVRTPDGPIRW